MLLRKVEKFLKTHDMPATKFGRLSAGDPRFVLDLRMGRTPRPATEARTLGWMAEFEAAQKSGAKAAQNRTEKMDATRSSAFRTLETKEFSYAV